MVLCDYCLKRAHLVTGKTIYPHRRDLWNKFFYLCAPCEAYVGCHPNTQTPLGRLADATLRAAKSRAHAAFDPMWRNGSMNRREAYAWLADQLKLPPNKCHIGMFEETQCDKVVAVCSNHQYFNDFEGF